MSVPTLCHRFGLDEEEIARRLDSLSFGDDDERALRDVRAVIAEHIEALVEGFYSHLLRFPELSRFISDADRLDRLKRSLAQHVKGLGEGVRRPEYFENRLRVGVTHEQNGILLKWYVAAYAHLRVLLTRLIFAEWGDDPRRVSQALISLHKAICLDVCLAVETYHGTALQRVETLLQQLERDQDEIRRLAQTDQLTGLLNRRHFLERLEAEFHRCRRYRHPLTLLIIDIDDFKRVNDTYGHYVGDEVLRSVGQSIRRLVRSTDLCGRLGGEELSIALIETPLSTARLIGDRIRLSISAQMVTSGTSPFSISLSLGIAEFSSRTPDTTTLLKQADDALYGAKRLGKNCICVADPADDAACR